MNWISGGIENDSMRGSFETAELENEPSNFILRAAYLHNRFASIYPFDENSEEMARLVMYYYLITKGYPPFSLNFSEQEYNDAIIEYLEKENIERFYSGIIRSVYNKLDVLLQLTSVE